MDSPQLSKSQMLSGVADLYTKSLEEHGFAPLAVGWKDGGQQLLRFDKLCEVLSRDDTGDVTVNDWGCGFASMFDYLDARLGERLVRYNGYDISEKMLVAARERVTDPRVVFFGSDVVEHECDYAFVSGTFNVRLQTSEQDWKNYVQETMRRLWATSRKGIAFNVLSTYVDWKEPHLFYADPCEFFDFCKRNLSHHVSLLHDYPLYEWTIVVKKNV